jgi:hypothetical protein
MRRRWGGGENKSFLLLFFKKEGLFLPLANAIIYPADRKREPSWLVLTWMVGANVTLTVVTLGVLITLASRLGEISGRSRILATDAPSRRGDIGQTRDYSLAPLAQGT